MMRVYTYSQARQNLSNVLDTARKEEVLIRRRSGETYCVTLKKINRSPFDLPGIKTKATTDDILKAVRESREL